MPLTIFLLPLRFPAEWFVVLVGPWQFNTPDNLIAAMAAWIAMETTALAFAVKAYINQRDKYDTMLEKVLTAMQEEKAAMIDNTEAIEVLVGELKRRNRAKGTGNRA